MFNLNLEQVADDIRKQRSRRVLVQLPDGLKPRAGEISDALERATGASVFIWLGDCFGGCDLPQGLDAHGPHEPDTPKIDLVVQWGHSRFCKEKDGW
ncbi:hypothetical protein COY95_00765 [Candidatus Woesearchaeota archaeon CG_4_10_14_0_8_um_filter_47_5]|nr:MAG: hypothetical protein COY95_00765 [Candidatus Woesearchaeota archaeon CG_4_10_14_0_8_um_filter_47_5]